MPIMPLHLMADSVSAVPGGRGGDLWVHGAYRLWAPDAARDFALLLGPSGVVSHGRPSGLLPMARELAGMRPARVLLLFHGLGRAARQMDRLAGAARREGLHPIRISYPSYQPIRRNLVHLTAFAGYLAEEGVTSVDAIGHSMGGVMARALMGRLPPTLAAGRLVTLGSPHRGAAAARLIRRKDLYPGSLDWLPPVAELGAVVGTILRSRGDGVVSTEEATPPGAKVLAVNALHNVLPIRPDIVAASLRFIQTGEFV